MTTTTLRGSCLCGAVHYEAVGEVRRFLHCHCSRCRKATGTGHASNLTAFREVANAVAARATPGEQLRAQRAQAQAEEVRFQPADLRYRNGVTSFLDVLDAQRALFTTQLATVQVQLSQIQNEVTLYKVLGGGRTEPVRQ